MIALGSDHGGFLLKEHIKAFLQSKGYPVLDCGCGNLENCDYPVYGKAAAQAVTLVLSSAPLASAFPLRPTR